MCLYDGTLLPSLRRRGWGTPAFFVTFLRREGGGTSLVDPLRSCGIVQVQFFGGGGGGNVSRVEYPRVDGSDLSTRVDTLHLPWLLGITRNQGYPGLNFF